MHSTRQPGYISNPGVLSRFFSSAMLLSLHLLFQSPQGPRAKLSLPIIDGPRYLYRIDGIITMQNLDISAVRCLSLAASGRFSRISRACNSNLKIYCCYYALNAALVPTCPSLVAQLSPENYPCLTQH